MQIRDATASDLSFLERMWHAAAFWRPEVFVLTMEEARAIPEIARYIAGWGRPGDVALIAEDDGGPLGAAWYRSFTDEEPGYGFVDERIPEIAIAVDAGARGTGVGTALMQALIDRATSDELPALSLSVNAENPSRRIYQRFGFTDVRGDDDSYVMVRTLT